jgi:hypothetical protein
VVKAISETLDLKWMLVANDYPREEIIARASAWVLVARQQATLQPFGKPYDPGKVLTVRPFTDEYSNVVKLLRMH